MKVPLPLSLKFTLWLVLNLALLAGAAAVFLIVQGGLSWDSLVAGASGDRINALANVVTGEASAVPAEDRSHVLARFSAAYGADFLLVRNHGPQIAGPTVDIPAAVRQRIDEGPPGFRGGRGLGPPGAVPRESEDDVSAPPAAGPGRGALAHGVGRGRFLLHAGSPAAWWIGLRVPAGGSFGRPGPATLVIRSASFWNVVRLLNLETWIIAAASVLLLSILFWLPLVHGITRDVRALTRATERIAEGRFDTRTATSRRDELGRLSASIDAMAGRLDTLVNGQKRFLGDVAHELGSPLGRLQVATEILENRAPANLQGSVKDIRDEVQQLAMLVNELLAFTHAGLKAREAELEPVALAPLVSRVIAREDKTGRVERALPADVAVAAVPALLDRAIGNLVRNALQHGGAAGPVTLRIIPEGPQVVITVEDRGPGVPEPALARLGEPFFRPDAARTRESGGVGLGLAIVRSAVLACGGELRFSNGSPHGFRAEIRLQAAAAFTRA